MYCPNCGKGTTRIYEVIETKTLRKREPEPLHCCPICIEECITGLIRKGIWVRVRLFKQ